MKNKVGGEIKVMEWAEFAQLFDPAIHPDILKAAELPGTSALVCFENLDLSSSELGRRSCLAVGPMRARTEQQALESHLGMTPSRFQYPVAIHRLKPRPGLI